MSDRNYEKERPIVERFLAMFGVTRPQLSNPNAGLKQDSGVDVVWTVDAGIVAFQVTEFHADRTPTRERQGSQLRETEVSKAASGRPYTMPGLIDPVPGLVAAIVEKVARTAHVDCQRFPERILLVASSLPHNGPVATFLLDPAFEERLPQLNAATHEVLADSVFDAAYIFNMLSLEGSPTVYKRNRQSGWRRLEARQQVLTVTERSGVIGFLKALSPLRTMTWIAHDDGLGSEFLQELVGASRDRDLTVDEIRDFERSYRARRGL